MENNEIVGRVAHAIYQKFEDRPTYAQGQMNALLAVELARAAIEAMREPCPHMVATALPLRVMPLDRVTILLTEKALSLLEPEDFPVASHADGVEAAQRLISDWRGMIDAALAIGEE